MSPRKAKLVEAPKDAVKVEFARRLQAAMHRKGWNQSELSREAQKHMPLGKPLGRDSVSGYIRAQTMPLPLKLDALCGALGVTREDLVPMKGCQSAGDDNPPLDVRDIGDGMAQLRVNQTVRWADAVEILRILKVNSPRQVE